MRISDWSSDVCSSDLSFVKAIGQFTQQNLRVLRLSGQITIPRPGANLVEKVINRRCESQRHLHVADGAFKPISIDGTNGIGGGRQLGRPACRGRVCQYGEITVVRVYLKKQNNHKKRIIY